ncbi:MAG: hypothetical protein ACOX3S_04670 [Anaerolineae bacterium]|jgi:hypothetical protein
MIASFISRLRPMFRPAAATGRLSLRANFSWTLVGNVVYAACQWGMLHDRYRIYDGLLCPDASNDSFDSLMNELKPYVTGARLLDADGGGFVLSIAKSSDRVPCPAKSQPWRVERCRRGCAGARSLVRR